MDMTSRPEAVSEDGPTCSIFMVEESAIGAVM